MIKAYTCNNEGTPSKAITPKDREGLLRAFKDFLDINEEDPTVREFHCAITPGVSEGAKLVREISISNYVRPNRHFKDDLINSTYINCKKNKNKTWHSSYDDMDDYCERDFEL